MKTGTLIRQRSWSWMLRNLILPLGDLAFGQKLMARLAYLENAQWWDQERVFRVRNQSLSQLIEVIYREVPYYREIMDQAKLKPGDILSPGDLWKLPISTKDILRKNYPDQVIRLTGQKTYQASTSGSTGKNFYVREDAETAGRYRAIFLLALEWAGWLFGEPQLQTGMTLTRSLDRVLKDWLLGCHYVSAFDLSDAHLDATLELMEKQKIRHLWGYPGSLYLLAKRAARQRWNLPLRSAVTWGDNLYSHYRETIESAFRTRVYDTYGCAEGIQISAQCEYGSYHIHDLDTLVEFLSDDGSPVPLGEHGNIVLTRLHPGPMPLVRYKIGDLGISAAGLPCPCGRGFGLMDSIQGRDTDIIITPDGNRLIVHFFTGILEFFPEIDTFQVIQDSLDSLTVRIVPTALYTLQSPERIITRLKEKGAANFKIQIELVDQIPLPPSGKRRFVISNIQAKPA